MEPAVAIRPSPEQDGSADRFLGRALQKAARLEQLRQLSRALSGASPRDGAVGSLDNGAVPAVTTRLRCHPDPAENWKSCAEVIATRAPGGDDPRRAPQGRIDKAAAYLRHARELGSGSAASFKDVGEALARLGRYEAATEHFRQAMQIDPHDAVALDHLAFNHFRGKRYAQALALYEEPRNAAGTPQGLTLNQVTERSLTHSTLICSAMI